MGCLESQHAHAPQPCRPTVQGYPVNQGMTGQVYMPGQGCAAGQPVQGYVAGKPWACSACTYLNPVAHLACEACGTYRPGYAQASCAQPGYVQPSYVQPLQPGYMQQPSYGYQQGAYQQTATQGGGMSNGMAMGMAGVGGLAAGFLAAEVIDDIF
eukprot:TRINITY_DN2647_c0_g2_i1.p1 TRINITY_DN2647_c0_g2~~TRINITY_DN2647_c0_g2_i1.p1  ORF type:complete len:179 (-),score=36.68 TRINITY_DN2647_c0_g2_i1:358-822(-)